MKSLYGVAVPFASVPLSARSEEHTSELQSRQYLVCRLLLEKNKRLTRQEFWPNTSQVIALTHPSIPLKAAPLSLRELRPDWVDEGKLTLLTSRRANISSAVF